MFSEWGGGRGSLAGQGWPARLGRRLSLKKLLFVENHLPRFLGVTAPDASAILIEMLATARGALLIHLCCLRLAIFTIISIQPLLITTFEQRMRT